MDILKLGKKLALGLQAVILTLGFGTLMLSPLLAGSALAAASPNANSLINDGADAACRGACNTSTSVNGIFSSLTTTLIFVIGSVSVVMIIVGGLRYVLSNGDSKSAEGARNTILYAVIGVVISISAYGIVKFVTGHFG